MSLTRQENSYTVKTGVKMTPVGVSRGPHPQVLKITLYSLNITPKSVKISTKGVRITPLDVELTPQI